MIKPPHQQPQGSNVQYRQMHSLNWNVQMQISYYLDLLEIQFEPEAAGTLSLSGNEAHL